MRSKWGMGARMMVIRTVYTDTELGAHTISAYTRDSDHSPSWGQLDCCCCCLYRLDVAVDGVAIDADVIAFDGCWYRAA